MPKSFKMIFRPVVFNLMYIRFNRKLFEKYPSTLANQVSQNLGDGLEIQASDYYYCFLNFLVDFNMLWIKYCTLPCGIPSMGKSKHYKSLFSPEKPLIGGGRVHIISF